MSVDGPRTRVAEAADRCYGAFTFHRKSTGPELPEDGGWDCMTYMSGVFVARCVFIVPDNELGLAVCIRRIAPLVKLCTLLHAI